MKTNELKFSHVWPIALGCLVFGAFMGWRNEFASIYVRAAMAGTGAAILALCWSVGFGRIKRDRERK